MWTFRRGRNSAVPFPTEKGGVEPRAAGSKSRAGIGARKPFITGHPTLHPPQPQARPRLQNSSSPKAEVSKLRPAGQVPPTASFCRTHGLTALYIFKWLKTTTTTTKERKNTARHVKTLWNVNFAVHGQFSWRSALTPAGLVRGCCIRPRSLRGLKF